MSKPFTVGVLGSSGVFGRHLVPRLIAESHSVRALVRRTTTANSASASGADVRIADIFDPESLRAALRGCDVAINLATALPSPTKAGDFDLNDRVRREGVPIFLDACQSVRVPRILQQSIGMVHSGGGDSWADETTRHVIANDSISGRAINAAWDMEDCVVKCPLDWLVLRGALFYGPGTGFDDDWFSRAHAAKLKVPGDGSEYVTNVHIADMADATVAAVSRWPSRQALIIADNEPMRWRDLFGYVCSVSGSADPQTGGPPRFPSFRLSNQRAKAALGWTPRYPTVRIGLVR
jgi:nucleoside-diphosphate-sugar epimerase